MSVDPQGDVNLWRELMRWIRDIERALTGLARSLDDLKGQVMAGKAEVDAALAALQQAQADQAAAIAAERQQVSDLIGQQAQAVQTLQDQVAQLQAQVAAGQDLGDVVAGINASVDALRGNTRAIEEIVAPGAG
ncbi:MAG TPA: hypothetical protein VFU47_12710 [Armatimonadota bacterium]|nr:hypothetical protein [Armatimonadota bacterium]